MQDPNNLNPNQPTGGNDQTGGNQPTGGNEPTGGEQTTEISLQDMLTGIKEQLGGNPSARDGAPQMDEVQKGIVDKQFEQDARNQLEDMQKEVKSKSPDASDTQAFNLGIAMMKGDIGAAMDAMRNIYQREADADEKNENQQSLHVEGGASGKREEGNIEGLGNTFDKMNRQYARRG